MECCPVICNIRIITQLTLWMVQTLLDNDHKQIKQFYNPKQIVTELRVGPVHGKESNGSKLFTSPERDNSLGASNTMTGILTSCCNDTARQGASCVLVCIVSRKARGHSVQVANGIHRNGVLFRRGQAGRLPQTIGVQICTICVQIYTWNSRAKLLHSTWRTEKPT